MKKILFIHHAVGWGGAPNSMIKLINSLDSTKYEAEVLLLKYSILAEILAENGIKYSVARSAFYRNYYHYFTYSEAGYLRWYQIIRFAKHSISWLLSRYYFSKKEISRHSYDIAHLNSSVLSDWLAATKDKGKVIIHIREPMRKSKLDILYKIFTYQMRKYADHIISVNNDNAKRINIPSKTTIVYNYSTIEMLCEINIEKYKSRSVLYVGGTAKIKGFYTLVDAMQYINHDITVYIAGTYRHIAKKDNNLVSVTKYVIRKTIHRKLALAQETLIQYSNVVILGMIPNINKYIDKSVCVISPFTVPHFARPIIEAYGRRKSAIGTMVEGMNEIIDHCSDGLLIEKGDGRSLAEAINYMCDNPEIAKNMGEAGYKKALLKFSPNNIEQIQNIYSVLIKNT